MTQSLSSNVAAEKARNTYRKTAPQFEELARENDVPEAMRALAEKNIAQTREIYESSKHALETVLETWERSINAAGQGAVALNRKVIDIAQRNINSSFDLAKGLAGARNLADAVELQAAHWRDQLDAFAAQAEEVRKLSTQVAADVAKPIKRGLDEVQHRT